MSIAIAVLLAVSLALPISTFASSENNPPGSQNQNANSNSNSNSPQGGQGGQGGNGGNSQNDNNNRNYNRNRNTNRNNNSQHQGQGQFQGQGQKQGQKQGQTNQPNQTIEGDNVQVYSSSPDVSAPALTSGNDVCVGSISGGAAGGNGIISAGLTFGRTYTDENCVRLKNANALHQMGLTPAALALLAKNKDVADALNKAYPGKFANLISSDVKKATKEEIKKETVVSTDPSRDTTETKDLFEAVRPDWMPRAN